MWIKWFVSAPKRKTVCETSSVSFGTQILCVCFFPRMNLVGIFGRLFHIRCVCILNRKTHNFYRISFAKPWRCSNEPERKEESAKKGRTTVCVYLVLCLIYSIAMRPFYGLFYAQLERIAFWWYKTKQIVYILFGIHMLLKEWSSKKKPSTYYICRLKRQKCLWLNSW